MAEPFAPVHLVSVLPYVNAKYAHSVVMDSRGRVYDPQYPEIKDFSPYGFAQRKGFAHRDKILPNGTAVAPSCSTTHNN